MNDQQITQFFTELRTKVDEAEKRVKELSATAKTAADKAQSQAKAQLAGLEMKAKEHHAKLEAAEAKAKKWRP